MWSYSQSVIQSSCDHCDKSRVIDCLELTLGTQMWLSGKESACQCRRCGFDPWVRKIPCRKKRQPPSSILAWEIPWTEEPGRLYIVHGVAESQTRLSHWTTATKTTQMSTRSLKGETCILRNTRYQGESHGDEGRRSLYCFWWHWDMALW